MDRTYRTRLGVSFYNRQTELGELDRSVQRRTVTIVYGPRNVGKSELVRYWIRKKGVKSHSITIEGDASLVESILEEMFPVEGKARKLIEEGLEALAGRLGLYDIYRIIAKAVSLLRATVNQLIIFIDEFHLLPRYRGTPNSSRYEVALADLEALSHYLAKRPQNNLRIILTVSEGFIATGDAQRRLHGYSTEFLLVDHLDEEHFKGLYEEYATRNPCTHGYPVIRGLIGGAPGYLPDVCPDNDSLEQFINSTKHALEEGLTGARNALREAGLDLPPRKLLETALTLMKGKQIRPLEEPSLHLIGQVMTTHNLVYPAYEHKSSAIIYKPQIPLYRLLLEAAVEHELTSVLPVRTHWVLSKIAR